MDDLDRKIIQKLKENCVKPFVRIGRELGVAEGTVRLRTKKLVDSGVIRKFTVDVEANSMGFPIVAFLLLSVPDGNLSKVAEQISRIQNVVEIHQIHTFGDLLVKLRVTSLESIADIVANKIKPIHSIAVNNTIPVLHVWKDSPA
jgi:Lrp/AsnC family transcriptional regulator for asnA, asnC and gidA